MLSSSSYFFSNTTQKVIMALKGLCVFLNYKIMENFVDFADNQTLLFFNTVPFPIKVKFF